MRGIILTGVDFFLHLLSPIYSNSWSFTRRAKLLS
jgi:hypothetical protein